MVSHQENCAFVSPPDIPTSHDPLLTIGEVIARTRECRAAVYRRLQLGELHGVKVGRRTFIRTSEVERYLRELRPYRSAISIH